MNLDPEKTPSPLLPDPFWPASAFSLGWPEWQVELLCNIAGPYVAIDVYGAWIRWYSGRFEYYRRDRRSIPSDIRPYSDEGSWSLSEYSTKSANERQRARLQAGIIENFPKGDSMPPGTYGACRGCGKVGLIDAVYRRCGTCGGWATGPAPQPDIRTGPDHEVKLSIQVTNTTPDPSLTANMVECDSIVLETDSATLSKYHGGYVVVYPPARAILGPVIEGHHPMPEQLLGQPEQPPIEPTAPLEQPPTEMQAEPPVPPPQPPEPPSAPGLVHSADEDVSAVHATTPIDDLDDGDDGDETEPNVADLPWMTEALDLGWPEAQVRSIRAHWATSTKMDVTKYVITAHLKSGVGSCAIRRRDDFDRVIDEERQMWNAIGGRPSYIHSSTEPLVDLDALDRRTYRCLPCARDGLRRDGLHKHPKTREYVCDDWEQIHPDGEQHTTLVAKMLVAELAASAPAGASAPSATIDADHALAAPIVQDLTEAESEDSGVQPPVLKPPPSPRPPPKLSPTIKNQLLLW